MHMWTCYIISMPRGRLVPNQSRNQCVTRAPGVSYFTANTGLILLLQSGSTTRKRQQARATPSIVPSSVLFLGRRSSVLSLRVDRRSSPLTGGSASSGSVSSSPSYMCSRREGVQFCIVSLSSDTVCLPWMSTLLEGIPCVNNSCSRGKLHLHRVFKSILGVVWFM
jgi:hypothetical protein